MDDIYIILPSNMRSQDSSFVNKTSNFKVVLPKELNLDSKWEVGLVEIIIPYTWYNTNINEITYLNLEINKIESKNIKAGYYKTAADMCDLIMETVPRDWFKGDVRFDKIRHKGIIELARNEEVILSNELSKILGFSKKHYKHPGKIITKDIHQYISKNISATNALEHLIYVYTNNIIKTH
jgi:hypothetical protein